MSQGEKQRLEIARALLNNPDFLVFDEATSALDSETEGRIFLNLSKRGCSTVWISHRLSTVKACHRILILDRGKIVEEGTHESLKESSRIYRELILEAEGR